jgi:hypothetical protein
VPPHPWEVLEVVRAQRLLSGSAQNDTGIDGIGSVSTSSPTSSTCRLPASS